jgi:2-polyprenyl-6-methoxyphenol hydroxylase-like FAD-dependent oxidoreductase
MTSAKVHAIIIGGGIAGPAIALFLKKIGITSTIYEAYPHIDDIGGGMQIAPNGMNVLKEIGVAERIVKSGALASEMCFRNYHGRFLARIRNGRTEKCGQPAVAIARSILHQILVDEVEQQGIRVEYQKRLKSITEMNGEMNCKQVIAQFEDGTTAEGDFLIGADGLRSRTRDILLPNSPKPFYTGMLGIGGFAAQSAIPASNPRDKTTMHMTFGPGGFFGYCNCSPSEESALLWWSNLPRAKELSKAELSTISFEDMREELLNIHKGWHEPIEMLLRNTHSLFKGGIYDIATLPTWHSDRTVLIGDAAHVMGPHTGQGASMALEDAMYLAKLLRHSPGQFPQVFAQFERDRRPRVEQIIAQTRRIGDSKKVSELNPIASWIRDQFMSVALSLFAEQGQDWMYNYRITWDN